MKRLWGKKKETDRLERLIHNFLESGGSHAPEEYVDYILMTELWHCPPSVFQEQEEKMIDLHTRIYNEKNRKEWKEQKRAEQKTSFKK